MGEKIGALLAAHVSIQNPRLGAGEVHVHQRVDRVAEAAIDVEFFHGANQRHVSFADHFGEIDVFRNGAAALDIIGPPGASGESLVKVRPVKTFA